MILDIEDMDAILDQFIAFMRDGSEEPIEQVDFNELLQEVAHQVHSQLTVVLDLQPLPLIALRRLSFKRVMANLMQNTLRYGAGPFEVKTWALADRICLRCRDHGPGIDMARAEELMQPFQRGDQARSTQGSGLGLAIVARIVRQHRGRIQLSNASDGGLELLIELPLKAHLRLSR